MQLLKYDAAAGTITTYHTISSREGTAGFECKATVALAGLSHATLMDGSDDPDRLLVVCPNAGCPGSAAAFPILGDTDAQRLHARARLADPAHPSNTLPEAIESVLTDVIDQRGVPSLELALEGIEDDLDLRSMPMLSAVKAEREALRVIEEARRAAVAAKDLAAVAAKDEDG